MLCGKRFFCIADVENFNKSAPHYSYLWDQAMVPPFNSNWLILTPAQCEQSSEYTFRSPQWKKTCTMENAAHSWNSKESTGKLFELSGDEWRRNKYEPLWCFRRHGFYGGDLTVNQISAFLIGASNQWKAKATKWLWWLCIFSWDENEKWIFQGLRQGSWVSTGQCPGISNHGQGDWVE